MTILATHALQEAIQNSFELNQQSNSQKRYLNTSDLKNDKSAVKDIIKITVDKRKNDDDQLLSSEASERTRAALTSLANLNKDLVNLKSGIDNINMDGPLSIDETNGLITQCDQFLTKISHQINTNKDAFRVLGEAHGDIIPKNLQTYTSSNFAQLVEGNIGAQNNNIQIKGNFIESGFAINDTAISSNIEAVITMRNELQNIKQQQQANGGNIELSVGQKGNIQKIRNLFDISVNKLVSSITKLQKNDKNLEKLEPTTKEDETLIESRREALLNIDPNLVVNALLKELGRQSSIYSLMNAERRQEEELVNKLV